MAPPEPAHLVKHCQETLQQMLVKAGGTEPEYARRIGEDALVRAEAFAMLSHPEQDVLTAPFVEDVFDHKPLDASLDMKAKPITTATYRPKAS